MFAPHARPDTRLPVRPQPVADERDRAGAATTLIDTRALNTLVGNNLRVVGPIRAQDTPLLDGAFSFTTLREGISLHCTDVVHLRPVQTRFAIQERCIKILLKLEGDARIGIGGQDIPMNAGQGSQAVARGAVVLVDGPDTVQRSARAGSRQRMVVLTLHPSWFDAAGIPHEIFREHVTVYGWAPSPRALAIAEQLIHPIALQGTLARLHYESRALELILEALAQCLPEQTAPAVNMSAADHQRVCRLRRFLDSGEADHLGMRRIARHIGCNTNTLNQLFREACGESIFSYLRKRRLQRAADALRYEGVSVARAAEIAGYSSQANFSTAFRRHFGLSPKLLRAKI